MRFLHGNYLKFTAYELSKLRKMPTLLWDWSHILWLHLWISTSRYRADTWACLQFQLQKIKENTQATVIKSPWHYISIENNYWCVSQWKQTEFQIIQSNRDKKKTHKPICFSLNKWFHSRRVGLQNFICIFKCCQQIFMHTSNSSGKCRDRRVTAKKNPTRLLSWVLWTCA